MPAGCERYGKERGIFGRYVDFTNDLVNGVVTEIRDKLGRTVSASFCLQTVTDAGGGVTTYTYDPNGVQYALASALGFLGAVSENGRLRQRTGGHARVANRRWSGANVAFALGSV